MKPVKFFLFLIIFNILLEGHIHAQANPSIAVLPANNGLVGVGASLDIYIEVGNTGMGTVAVAKLRPIVTLPASVTFLANAEQSLPAGWSILTNTGNQLRFCNTSFVIPAQSTTVITLKVRGVAVSGPQTFSGQINFGNGTTCAAGTSVFGDNTADNTATSTIQVVPGCPLGINVSAPPIACSNGTTSITATANGASGPVEYSLTGSSPFQTSNIFSNVGAGTYNVTVRDISNPTTCIRSASITITSPDPVAAPAVGIVHPTCSNPNGIISINSSTTGLTFSVDGGPFETYPTIGYALPAGNHNIVAKNANNCTSPATQFVVNAQPATPATPTVGSVIQPDCNINTGSITLSNLPAGNWVIAPGNINGNTATTNISNLAAGNYSFTVTNAVGCTSAATANIQIIAVLGAPAEPTVTTIQPSCTIATGSITVTSTTNGINFSLDGGPFGPYPSAGYAGLTPGMHSLVAQNVSGCLSPISNIIINAQPASPSAPTVTVTQPTCTLATGSIMVTSNTSGVSFSLDGNAFVSYPAGGFVVAAGVHTLAIQNGSGCAPNLTTNIVVNAQPATPAVTATFTPITCFNGNSIISASAIGGVTPYQYSLNGGSFQTPNNFTVTTGTYNIAVKDANGCVGNSGNVTITQPTAITATATTTSIACNGGNTTLTVTATGGVGTYEYRINNGNFQASNSFTVTAGTYNVSVRLANNPSCGTSISSPIIVTQPNVLKAIANANAIAECGGNTQARITAIGGTLPYSGTGSFIRGPGNFNFVVVDAKGCSSNVDLVIIPPGCVELEVYPNPAHSVITVNHSPASSTDALIQIFNESGNRVLSQKVPQLSFKTNMNVANLASGAYSIIYTNGNDKKVVKFIKTNQP
jgi:hypothetical protein